MASPTPRRSPTIIPTVGVAQSSLGPVVGPDDSAPIWHILGTPGLLVWHLGSGITDDDGATCIETSGGQVGRFLRERCPDRGADLANADATIYPSGKRWRVLPAATLSANRVLTLGAASSTQSVEEGDWILFTREDVSAFTVTIRNIALTTLAVMPASQRSWCLVQMGASDWAHRASGLALATV